MRPHVEPPSAHHLCSRVHRHIPCTSLNSSSFPLFHSLCLGDSVFVCIHPFFSRQSSLNDRSDSLSASVIMWFCRSSMRRKRSTTRTTSCVFVSLNVSRQNVESSQLNLRRSPPECRDTRRGKSTLHFVRGEGDHFQSARSTSLQGQGVMAV